MDNKVSLKKRNSIELTPKDINLLKTCSKLSEQEVRNVYAEFLQECPNGKLDKTAFIKFYKKIDEEKGTEIVYNGVFSVFDSDQKGTVDFGEFLLAVSILSSGDLDTRLDFMFEMCDLSNDGYIDRKEFSNWITIALTLVEETKNPKDNNTDPRAMGIATRLISSFTRFMTAAQSYKKMKKQEFINTCKNNPQFVEIFEPKK